MYRALIHLNEQGRVVLPEDELHHLVRVRRARRGGRFLVLDGASAELKLVLDEKGEFSLKELIQENRQATSCLVIVGPEGGWDETDRLLFQQKKVPSVSLGARILRAETRPLTILSIPQYELGDLSP